MLNAGMEEWMDGIEVDASVSKRERVRDEGGRRRMAEWDGSEVKG
jgi:hypothetical protein